MSFKKLEDFISIAKSAGASELKYEDGDKKFAIAFPTALAPVMVTAPVSNTIVAPEKKSNGNEVTSPFVGTFYSSSSPETAAFVKVGDKVSKGQVLCIVEAMKIMNEIESEVSGEVVDICVDNESYVEFGQALFVVKP